MAGAAVERPGSREGREGAKRAVGLKETQRGRPSSNRARGRAKGAQTEPWGSREHGGGDHRATGFEGGARGRETSCWAQGNMAGATVERLGLREGRGDTKRAVGLEGTRRGWSSSDCATSVTCHACSQKTRKSQRTRIVNLHNYKSILVIILFVHNYPMAQCHCDTLWMLNTVVEAKYLSHCQGAVL